MPQQAPAPSPPPTTQPPTVTEKPSPPQPTPKPEAIPWSEAIDYVGQTKTVEGPVVSTKWASGSRDKPTFMDIGKGYPNPDRFTVVIWDSNRSKFKREFPPNPETYLLNKTVRVRGLIETYKGMPQIVSSDPADIWVVE